jgi:hypothetical protein
MRKLIILLLFPFMAKSQTVDNAVKQTIKPSIDSLKDAISKVQVPANVIWEEVLQVNVTRAGNIDTITTPGLYQISVSGSATAVRIIAFNNGIIRTSNPLAWSGAGSWSASVINGRVIISTTGTGLTYQRRKL